MLFAVTGDSFEILYIMTTPQTLVVFAILNFKPEN